MREDGRGVGEEEQVGIGPRATAQTRTVSICTVPQGGVETHWRGSACFCRKATAAGALQATYLWMNCTNLLMKGARWREDFR